MSDFDDFKATYFEECAELISELEEQLAAIGDGDRSPDRLNAVFRAIHSIKGGAGAFGFSALVGFAHALESLLDQVRDGRLPMGDELAALCLRSVDIVADFVAAARAGTDLPEEFGAPEKARFDALCRGDAASGDEDGEPIEEFDIDFTPVRVTLAGHDDEPPAIPAPDSADAFAEPPLSAEAGHWEIRFTPHRALYSRANDPLLLFRELALLGDLSVTALVGDVPPLADFEPFGVYCTWLLTLHAPTAGDAAIREVFEFVEGDCDLSIAPLGALVSLDVGAEDARPLPSPPRPHVPEPMDLALELDLPAAGTAPADEDFADLLSLLPATLADIPDDTPAAPEPSFAELAAAIQPTPVAAPPVAPAPRPVPVVERPAPEPAAANGNGGGLQSIRVDLDKIDRVVNMVGELVITQSMLTQQMDDQLRARYSELVRGLEVLAQTTRGLQDSVMAIRAQPVKTVFSRLPRLVRELATKTGKSIRLETIGEGTEIDKTIIEQLSDPLTHMVRNSADHGIEKPEKRLAAGKQETGVIRLSAEQAGGNILIIVEDDGAGINRERVARLARERGIVAPDQPLSDEQIDQLIFAPGFSTAETISDISGRGVGMDVVLSNIKKIGGSVHVRSWPGRGTRMTLRLPLTLAVLDVMLVSVGGSPYVIPLSSIVETIQCSRAEFGRAPSGARVLRVRGDYVQVVDVGDRFGMRSGTGDDGRFVVLCEAEGSARIALVVDDIIGQQQVVIKSLEENFERVEGIAGGTILGDGNVALIIDVQGLKSSVPHRTAA